MILYKNDIFFNFESKTSGIKNFLFNTAFSSINIPDFELEKQKKISHIISIIDLKIDLNNKINLELENTAKTLYNYLFVQFDFPNED
jgi:type I restriction enzyme, S subunit